MKHRTSPYYVFKELFTIIVLQNLYREYIYIIIKHIVDKYKKRDVK